MQITTNNPQWLAYVNWQRLVRASKIKNGN